MRAARRRQGTPAAMMAVAIAAACLSAIVFV
jgi:hypothetical protein